MKRATGAVVGAFVLVACRPCDERPPDQTDDTEDFRLLRGRFTAADRVELVFSRPLAPVDDVDPSKWRLSAAWGTNDDNGRRCFSTTNYCDLSLGFADVDCRGCASYGYYDYGDDCPPRVEVIGLERDEVAPTHLLLQLSEPIKPLLCLQLEYTDGAGMILPHFSALDLPTISDVDGVPLDAIAPAWVLEDLEGEYFTDSLFPRRETLIPLPCPEDFG